MRLLLIAAALLLPGRAEAQAIERWRDYIAQASQRFGMPDDWIARVIEAESGGRTTLDGRPITSRAGAMGLMQLMPATWAEVRARHGLGPDPHDPLDNILAGTAYLRLMYDRFGSPGLFAAYNAGPGRYARHLASGRPLPAETVAYLAAVASEAAPATSAPEQTPVRSIFAVRRAPGANPDLPQPAGSGLFVTLRQARTGRDAPGQRGGGAIADER